MTVLTPRQILDRLVSFPTVSRDSNLALVDWLEGYLTGHGVRCFRHWNEDRQKAALIAHAGPWERGRRGAVGPFRRGAGRRADLDHRPLDRDRT